MIDTKAKEIFDLISQPGNDILERSKQWWTNLESENGMDFSVMVAKKLCQMIVEEAEREGVIV